MNTPSHLVQSWERRVPLPIYWGLLFGIFLANMTVEYSFPDIILATDIQGQVFYRGPVPESTTIPITKDSEVCGTSRKNTPFVFIPPEVSNTSLSVSRDIPTRTQTRLKTMSSPIKGVNLSCSWHRFHQPKIHVSNRMLFCIIRIIRDDGQGVLNVVLFPDSKGITKTFKTWSDDHPT